MRIHHSQYYKNLLNRLENNFYHHVDTGLTNSIMDNKITYHYNEIFQKYAFEITLDGYYTYRTSIPPSTITPLDWTLDYTYGDGKITVEKNSSGDILGKIKLGSQTVDEDYIPYSWELIFNSQQTDGIKIPELPEEIKSWDLDLSIELLLGEYFAGADTHEDKLLATYLKFLKRFYKEYFTDAREGAALNLLNTTQQTNLGYTADDVNLNADNVFEGITPLAPFADNEVFVAKPTANNGANNVMNIDNLSSEKQTALKDLVKKLHDFEGQVDPDTFMNHLDKAVKTTLSKSEFDTMITETVNSPSSLSYIPRFDIGNINYSFIQYLFSLKKDNDTDTLGKYRLFANS